MSGHPGPALYGPSVLALPAKSRAEQPVCPVALAFEACHAVTRSGRGRGRELSISQLAERNGYDLEIQEIRT